MFCFEKNRILMQFHLTGRCNLNCKHCYRTEGNVEPLTTKDIKKVIDSFLDLRKTYNSFHDIKHRGHINITGGEPFIRSDIKEIIGYLGSKDNEISYGILSNGSFIDDEMTELLRASHVSFVQLSIDGNEETHDHLRAKGDYKRVFDTAQRLEERGIRTYISFTANKENYKQLPHVAKECRKRGITKLWSDRLVPIGSGEDLKEFIITKNDIKDYIKTLKKARGNPFIRRISKTQVTMNRALQFMKSKGNIYHCSAGASLITVDEFGRVMPCRRMPIICGNIFDSSLEEIYYQNEIFKALRNADIPKECSGCKYSFFCRGGARCQSYAVSGNFNRADPGCPINLKQR